MRSRISLIGVVQIYGSISDYYNNDLTDKDEFGINAKKFLNQQVSVEGRVGFGDNDNTYGVRAAYRF
ncbi:hypothetical protein C3422_09045 [Acinetobacter sp. ABNIH27]|nr:hypothetical protein C3422_09045 [Acinetobacter sp. ABNIH27]